MLMREYLLLLSEVKSIKPNAVELTVHIYESLNVPQVHCQKECNKPSKHGNPDLQHYKKI